MSFVNRLIKNIILSFKENDYTSYEKVSFLKYNKIIDKEIKDNIERNIENNIDDYRKLSIFMAMLFSISIIFLMPFVMSLFIYFKYVIIVDNDYQKVHPTLIMNCVYDQDCNEPIKNLNIHYKKDVVKINDRALDYYKGFIKSNPNHNFAESEYNKVFMSEYVK